MIAANLVRSLVELVARPITPSGLPPIPEFVEMISDTGCAMYACPASVDLFGLTNDDFIDQIHGVITVGDFYAKAAGGQNVFT